MEKSPGCEDAELQKTADALRTFASRLSAQVGGAASAHHDNSTSSTPAAAAATIDEGDVEVLPDESFCFSVPCLQLRSGNRSGKMIPSGSSRSPVETLEEASAQSLGQMIHVTRRDELSNLPSRLLTNCLASFCRLLEARCKQCIQALIGSTTTTHCFNSCGEAACVARLLAKLVTQNPEAATINYKTLDFAERCDSLCATDTICDIEQSGTAKVEDSKRTSSYSSVVVPVILEVVVQWNLWESAVVISSDPLVAPGVLQGGEAFSDCSSRTVLRTIRMEIDTKAFLHSMMQQAKLIVRKALLAATCLVRQSQPFKSPVNDVSASFVARSKSSDLMHQQPNAKEKRKHREQEGSHHYAMMPPPPKRAPSGEGQHFTNINNAQEAEGAQALPNANFSMVFREQTASDCEVKKKSDPVPALALLTDAIKRLEES